MFVKNNIILWWYVFPAKKIKYYTQKNIWMIEKGNKNYYLQLIRIAKWSHENKSVQCFNLCVFILF